MAIRNPDPHEGGFVFIPANRVTGIFHASEDAQRALRALSERGWGDQRVAVFCGVEGADKLDLKGQHHGAAFHIVRKVEAFVGDVEAAVFPEADDAMRAGGCVVAVLVDGEDEQKEQVAEILETHHGQSIQYWGRWTIEKLG